MLGRTVSHYEITAKIGGGGMGQVYKAVDTKLNRPVALKFVHPQLVTDEDIRRRFLNEARNAAALQHNNICTIHEIDETPDGRPFISMAYYPGQSLGELLKARSIELPLAFRFATGIAEGLACAHAKMITHRDIKPGNIMITDAGEVKILDFGLARLSGSTHLTKTGNTVGTVRYMAPEQARGREVDHRADIWAFGVILYEMVTGTYPFRGDIEPAIIYSILNDEPQPAHEANADLTEAGSQIIARCMAKEPEQRYQSFVEVIEDINDLAMEMGWGSHSWPVMVQPARPKPWRRRVAIGLSAIVAAAAVAYIGSIARRPTVYSTEMRLALMPLENRTHPARDRFVAGVNDVLYEMLDQASRQHKSMWVVPNRLVRYMKLATDGDAAGVFGVNRIITGDVQRFSDRQLLLLELRDAGTLDVIRSASVAFDIESPLALTDSLAHTVARVLDFREEMPDFLLPNNAHATKAYFDGVGSLQEGDADAARVSLEQVLERDSTFAAGRGALGWVYWRQFRASGKEALLDRSIEQLETAAVLGPNRWRARYRLGEINRLMGDNDAAIVAYQQVLQDDPGNQLAARRLSRIYEAQSRFDEAERTLRRAIEERSDYFEAHRLLAQYFWRTDDNASAELTLTRALALAPDDAISLNLLGAIHQVRGEFMEAKLLFERAFQMLPDCDTCGNIALMLYFQKRYADSANYYELALEYCDVDNYVYWANWATSLYWVDGQQGKAIDLFKKAIELATQELQQDPDDPTLLGRLIEYNAKVGDEDSMRELIARAEMSAGTDPDVLYAIGSAYEAFGDRIAALRYLTDALRHGFPVERILGTVELEGLIQDTRFQDMVTDAEESAQSPSASPK